MKRGREAPGNEGRITPDAAFVNPMRHFSPIVAQAQMIARRFVLLLSFPPQASALAQPEGPKMLRALLMLVALAIIVLIVLAATGMVSLSQTQQAQAPAFDVKVKDINVGTTTQNVQVPTVGMETKQVEVPTVTVGDAAPANAQ
jgi:hypothetical protein